MNNRGQALLETVGFGLVVGGLLACLLGFTQQFLLRQRLLIAARHAAMLYSSGRFTSQDVKARTRKFLSEGNPALNPNALEIHIGRWGGFHGMVFQLDGVRLRYHAKSAWMKRLHLQADLEETCVIKHAAPYGLSWQPAYGPPVSWWQAPNVEW